MRVNFKCNAKLLNTSAFFSWVLVLVVSDSDGELGQYRIRHTHTPVGFKAVSTITSTLYGSAVVSLSAPVMMQPNQER